MRTVFGNIGKVILSKLFFKMMKHKVKPIVVVVI